MQAYFRDVDSAVLKRLDALARAYAESAEDLFAKWEAFSLSSGVRTPSASTIDGFETHLEKRAASSRAKRPKLRSNVFSTKNAASESADLETEAVNATVVKTFFNQDTDKAVPVPANFAINTDLRVFETRPFNQQPSDIQAELDNEIEDMIQRIISQRRLKLSDIVSAQQINQNPVLVVGRLCRAPNDESSWALQGPKRLGGFLTAVDLQSVHPEYKRGLFSGAIVIFRGKNAKGDVFSVSEVLDLPQLHVASLKSVIQEGEVLRVIVARAPDGLKKLDSVLSYSNSVKSSATVLLGPFATKVSEFASVQRRLAARTKQRSVPFVLVPSPLDSETADPLFPQPCLPGIDENAGSTVASVSNPCTFSLGEAAFTVANVSSLKDMDLTYESACQQVLRQRRLYPVYPPPPGTSIDVPKLKSARIENVAPNILVLPGDESLVAVVDDVLCVSLGPLDEFMEINVLPGTKTVALRTSVSIKQISI